MNQPDHYLSIENAANGEFRDRGSKFIAYAFPVEDSASFKITLKHFKKVHPKAVHHCFAYRIGTSGDNFRANDDGEPSGTAGKQILGQIDTRHLTNVAVVVVRYFGGSLLGVPGLINAYKTAASNALQAAIVVRNLITISYEFQFEYPLMNEVMLILKSHECTVIDQQHLLFSTVKAKVPIKAEGQIISKINDLDKVVAKKIV